MVDELERRNVIGAGIAENGVQTFFIVPQKEISRRREPLFKFMNGYIGDRRMWSEAQFILNGLESDEGGCLKVIYNNGIFRDLPTLGDIRERLANE